MITLRNFISCNNIVPPYFKDYEVFVIFPSPHLLCVCVCIYIYIYICVDFGGLGVACWPLVPKFAGSNLAEASARFPSEGK